MIRKLALLFSVAFLVVPANAKDIPVGQRTEVTGTATLKGDYLSFNSNDTVLDGSTRYPIKDMPVWWHGPQNQPPALYKALLKTADTGKPITLKGVFRWTRNGDALIFYLAD